MDKVRAIYGDRRHLLEREPFGVASEIDTTPVIDCPSLHVDINQRLALFAQSTPIDDDDFYSSFAKMCDVDGKKTFTVCEDPPPKKVNSE